MLLRAAGRLSPGLLGPLAEAAFAMRLQLVISNLLHRLWDSGVSLGDVEVDTVAWMHVLITSWSTPRLDASSLWARPRRRPEAAPCCR